VQAVADIAGSGRVAVNLGTLTVGYQIGRQINVPKPDTISTISIRHQTLCRPAWFDHHRSGADQNRLVHGSGEPDSYTIANISTNTADNSVAVFSGNMMFPHVFVRLIAGSSAAKR
jgi:hypothetical protein